MSILKRPGWSNLDLFEEMSRQSRTGFDISAAQQKVAAKMSGTAYRIARMYLWDFLKSKGLEVGDKRPIEAKAVNAIVNQLSQAGKITPEIEAEFQSFLDDALSKVVPAQVASDIVDDSGGAVVSIKPQKPAPTSHSTDDSPTIGVQDFVDSYGTDEFKIEKAEIDNKNMIRLFNRDNNVSVYIDGESFIKNFDRSKLIRKPIKADPMGATEPFILLADISPNVLIGSRANIQDDNYSITADSVPQQTDEMSPETPEETTSPVSMESKLSVRQRAILLERTRIERGQHIQRTEELYRRQFGF